MMKLVRSLALTGLLLSHPALAQDDSGDRLEQLEQDVMMLKRHQDRARTMGDSDADAPLPADGGIASAQSDARITALEEELRSLRGRIEESGFENRRIAEEFAKFKRDTEFRLIEMEKQAATPPVSAPAPAPAREEKTEKEEAPAAAKTPGKKIEMTVKEVPLKTPAKAEEPPAAAEAPKADEPPAPTPPEAGDTPRDHYNYAFRLLNQNQYDDAAKSFAQFTKKFPKDPLVGNAYYWQGETYYIRKDYPKAADHFRQGFEAMPGGPKAPDNLLKLGMSLAALKKKEEACVVLSQVMTKYKTSSANTAAKAAAEHKRNSCE